MTLSNSNVNSISSLLVFQIKHLLNQQLKLPTLYKHIWNISSYLVISTYFFLWWYKHMRLNRSEYGMLCLSPDDIHVTKAYVSLLLTLNGRLKGSVKIVSVYNHMKF